MEPKKKDLQPNLYYKENGPIHYYYISNFEFYQKQYLPGD